MTHLKVASWNINGVRARLPLLKSWIETETPDILCLQEIKISDDLFPVEIFENLGYHVEIHGQKSFNGVAILAKKSPFEVLKNLPNYSEDPQSRYLEAVFEWGNKIIRVASIYCPNGNPVGTEKYSYKLNWMNALIRHVKKTLNYEEATVFVGDYNIIPQEIDAKHCKKWMHDALFLPESREIFQTLLSLGLTDAIRACTDLPSYTFWDYQSNAWNRDDGIRIDHALLSPEAADLLVQAYPQKDVRGKEKPSDHIPIWIKLKI